MMNNRGKTEHAVKRLWRSVWIEPVYPGTSRERSRNLFDTLILHLHPPTVPERTLRFTLTWGLGGMALILVLLLALTGVLLLFAYEPSPAGAYASLERLGQDSPFGPFVRGIHHWSAYLLVVMAFLHLLRVYFTGAFTGPRAFNWVIGLGLFGFVLLANLTGYLLPWDQRAFWAVTICTSMLGYIPLAGPPLQELLRGGAEIGPAALLNFYVLHTTILPLGLVALLPFHFWRIRKAGGLVVPKEPGEALEGRGGHVTTIPHLVTREAVTALVLIAAVLLFAALVSAPLGAPANPGMSPNPARAPWYFLGLQELLMHFHPLFAVFVIPFLLTAALALLPYGGLSEETAGVWFISARGRKVARRAAAASLSATPLFIAVSETLKGAGGGALASPVSGGVVPFTVLVALFSLSYFGLRKKGGATRSEAVQGIFVFLVVALAVLTLTGFAFRGEGMALAGPWK